MEKIIAYKVGDKIFETEQDAKEHKNKIEIEEKMGLLWERLFEGTQYTSDLGEENLKDFLIYNKESIKAFWALMFEQRWMKHG